MDIDKYLTLAIRLKVIRHTLQFTRSEKIQSYSTVVWYSLMLTIKDHKVDEKSTSITKDHISFYCPDNF